MNMLMCGVLIGGSLGILAKLLIFPRNVDREFCQQMVRVLDAYRNYFHCLMNQWLQQDAFRLQNKDIEMQLLQLPTWVERPGFNAHLKTGYQFFLRQVECISEVLFSLRHLMRYRYEQTLLATLHEPLQNCADAIEQFFKVIIQRLELKEITMSISDLAIEIDALEKQFYTFAPATLELLDIKKDYVNLAEFIYNLRELRKFLLSLTESLRPY